MAARTAPVLEPAPAEPDDAGIDISEDVEIETDGSPGAQISDDGIAEAELALEAMTNFRLAEAALQRNDTATAERLAQKAVDGDRTQAEYVTLLAWIRALGAAPAALDVAIRTMTEVLIADPDNERALLYRGKLYKRTNRVKEAIQDFNALIGANPHNREAASELRMLKMKR